MSKVICVRFNSGEEIIGRVVEEILREALETAENFTRNTSLITLEQVRGITAQQIGKNEMGIAFFPWSLGNTDGKFTINLASLSVAPYSPESNLESGYLEQTSKIQMIRPGTPSIKM